MCSRVDLSLDAMMEAVSGLTRTSGNIIASSRLLSICADWLDYKEQTGRFCIGHTSMYEFLLAQPELNLASVNSRVAEICFDTIETLVHPSQEQEIYYGSFASYAVNNIVWHLSVVEPLSETRERLMSRISILQEKHRVHKDIAVWLDRIKVLFLNRHTLDRDALNSKPVDSLDVGVGSMDYSPEWRDNRAHSNVITCRCCSESRAAELAMSSVLDKTTMMSHGGINGETSNIMSNPSLTRTGMFDDSSERGLVVRDEESWCAASSIDSGHQATAEPGRRFPLPQNLQCIRKRKHQPDSLSEMISVGSGSNFSERGAHKALNDDHSSYTPLTSDYSRSSKFSHKSSYQSGLRQKLPPAFQSYTLGLHDSVNVEFASDITEILRSWGTEELDCGYRRVGVTSEESNSKMKLSLETFPVEAGQLQRFYIKCIWSNEARNPYITIDDMIGLIHFIFRSRLSTREEGLIRKRLETFAPFKPLAVSQHAFQPAAAGSSLDRVQSNSQVEGFSWVALPLLIDNIVAYVRFSMSIEDSSNEDIYYPLGVGDYTSPSVPSDLRDGLASTKTNPPNALFAIATWDLLYLLATNQILEAHQWTQKNVFG